MRLRNYEDRSIASDYEQSSPSTRPMSSRTQRFRRSHIEEVGGAEPPLFSTSRGLVKAESSKVHDDFDVPKAYPSSRRQSLCMPHMRPAENPNVGGMALHRSPQTTSDVTSAMLARSGLASLNRAASNLKTRRGPNDRQQQQHSRYGDNYPQQQQQDFALTRFVSDNHKANFHQAQPPPSGSTGSSRIQPSYQQQQQQPASRGGWGKLNDIYDKRADTVPYPAEQGSKHNNDMYSDGGGYSDSNSGGGFEESPPPTYLTYSVPDPCSLHTQLLVQFDQSFVDVHLETSRWLDLLVGDSRSLFSSEDLAWSTASLRELEVSFTKLGEGLLEVERKLHSWMIYPPNLQPLPENIQTHGGVVFPANGMVGAVSGAPSHFVTVDVVKGYLIPYVSDCYNDLSDREVWQAWIHLARSGAAALLNNQAVLGGPSHQSYRVVLSLCCRKFAQYGLLMHSSQKHGSVHVYPLTGRLSWKSNAARKKLHTVSIAVANWLRSINRTPGPTH